MRSSGPSKPEMNILMSRYGWNFDLVQNAQVLLEVCMQLKQNLLKSCLPWNLLRTKQIECHGYLVQVSHSVRVHAYIPCLKKKTRSKGVRLPRFVSIRESEFGFPAQTYFVWFLKKLLVLWYGDFANSKIDKLMEVIVGYVCMYVSL